jgi:hypothetical protein
MTNNETWYVYTLLFQNGELCCRYYYLEKEGTTIEVFEGGDRFSVNYVASLPSTEKIPYKKLDSDVPAKVRQLVDEFLETKVLVLTMKDSNSESWQFECYLVRSPIVEKDGYVENPFECTVKVTRKGSHMHTVSHIHTAHIELWDDARKLNIEQLRTKLILPSIIGAQVCLLEKVIDLLERKSARASIIVRPSMIEAQSRLSSLFWDANFAPITAEKL